MIIGRKEELKLFGELMNSNKSEFVRNPHPHLAIINTLAGKKSGMTRAEILDALGFCQTTLI